MPAPRNSQTLSRLARHTKGVALQENGYLILMIAGLLLVTVLVFGERVANIFTVTQTSIVNQKAPGNTNFASLYGTEDTGITVGTILELNFHAQTQQDDLVLAFLTHRDTLTTPSGWTIVSSEYVEQNASNQRLTILSKLYNSADGTSLTFNQASSQRFLGTLVTVRGKTPENITVVGTTTGTDRYREGLPITAPSDNTLVLTAVSENFLTTNAKPTHNMNVYPRDTFALLTPPSVSGNRLGVAAAWIENAGDSIGPSQFNVDNLGNGAGRWANTTLMIN